MKYDTNDSRLAKLNRICQTYVIRQISRHIELPERQAKMAGARRMTVPAGQLPARDGR